MIIKPLYFVSYVAFIGFPGFRGCVEYIKFNGHLLSYNGYNEIVDANSSPPDFQTFCISPNHCVLTPCLKDSCLSEPCWNDSDCGSSSKDDYLCICLYNVSSCGSCSSDVVHSEACSQTQESVRTRMDCSSHSSHCPHFLILSSLYNPQKTMQTL